MGRTGSNRVGRVIPGQPGLSESSWVRWVIPSPVGSSHANPGSFSVVHLTPGRGPPGHPPPGFQPDQPATRVNPKKTPGPTHFFPRLAKLDVPVRRVVRLSMFANTCIMQWHVARLILRAHSRPAAYASPMFVHVCACTNVLNTRHCTIALYAPILSVHVFRRCAWSIGAPCTRLFARSRLTHPEGA